MHMIHELNQELWLDTPIGRGLCIFLVDRGPNADNEWVCVDEKTGELWAWKSYDVRVTKCRTMGINLDKPMSMSDYWRMMNSGKDNKHSDR